MSETNFFFEDSSDDEKDSLPMKSQDRYKLVYDTFIKWKNDNQASSFDELVLICYFKDCEKKCVQLLYGVSGQFLRKYLI